MNNAAPAVDEKRDVLDVSKGESHVTSVLESHGESAIPAEELAALTDDLIAALKTVYDPEIPVDIYELGLIYKIDVSDDRDVAIEMTLTAPGCPVAGTMPGMVEDAVRSVPGVGDVSVNMTFDPPWDAGRMSDEARVALNMF
ncbi:MAG: SUF system Fe-S cluster assembly protein [Parvibaculaceae bacterium]|nr:SUF system Fe-S cluster assembly protein [Parvibaculaceae bacterium]